MPDLDDVVKQLKAEKPVDAFCLTGVLGISSMMAGSTRETAGIFVSLTYAGDTSWADNRDVPYEGVAQILADLNSSNTVTVIGVPELTHDKNGLYFRSATIIPNKERVKVEP